MDLRGAATAGRSSSENQAMQHCIDDFFLPWARFPFQLDLNTSETTNLHLNLLGPTHFFHPADSLDSAAFKISLAGLVELGHMEVHQHGWASRHCILTQKDHREMYIEYQILYYTARLVPQKPAEVSLDNIIGQQGQSLRRFVWPFNQLMHFFFRWNTTLYTYMLWRWGFSSILQAGKLEKNLRWGLPVLRFDQDKWKRVESFGVLKEDQKKNKHLPFHKLSRCALCLLRLRFLSLTQREHEFAPSQPIGSLFARWT